MGRPSTFTQEKVDAICLRLADGETLKKICEDKDMPGRCAVRKWLKDYPDFRAQYEQARVDQADTFAELGLEAALNEKDPQRARLVWDAYRWYAAKLRPRAYGDKVQHANEAGDGNTVIEYCWKGELDKPSNG